MSVKALAKAMPRHLKIGPYPFTLGFAEGWIKIDNEKKWGICDHATQVITISDPEVIPNETMLVGVAWHEVLHAIWAAQSLPNKAKEEDAVGSLEIGTITFFKENPSFVTWMMKGLK